MSIKIVTVKAGTHRASMLWKSFVEDTMIDRLRVVSHSMYAVGDKVFEAFHVRKVSPKRKPLNLKGNEK